MTQLSLTARFCMDTNVYGDFWDTSNPYRAYPLDVHKRVWEFFEARINTGEVISPSEVRDQLAASDLQPLKDWMKKHKTTFIEMEDTPGLEENLKQIVKDFPGYENTQKADPVDAVVVATAMCLKLTVITSEKRSESPKTSPKVPNVCDEYGIKCMTINEFLRAEGYVA